MRPAVALLFLGIGGCIGVSADGALPAVLAQSSPADHAAVAAAVQEALGRDDVRLAADAFVHSSSLIVEPRLEGRDLRRPEHLQLLQQGNLCLVRHESGRTARLAAQCKPEQ